MNQLKFRLGQKVKYKRISKKIEIDRQFWVSEDFKEGEEKKLERREFIELDKERTGYIMGRRKLTFNTIFSVNNDNYDDDHNIIDFVNIERQEYKFAYLVAYNMGKTDYVLEGDLKNENK